MKTVAKLLPRAGTIPEKRSDCVAFRRVYLIPTRSRQACSKQACLGDLAQIICITFIIQVVQAI